MRSSELYMLVVEARNTTKIIFERGEDMDITLILIISFLGISSVLLWGAMLLSFMWHKQEDEEINNLIKRHKHLRNDVNENMCHIYEHKKEQRELREMYSCLNSRINEEKIRSILNNDSKK